MWFGTRRAPFGGYSSILPEGAFRDNEEFPSKPDYSDIVRKWFSHNYDGRCRTKKGCPRGGFRDGACKNLLAPPCLGEALRRGALPTMIFNDFHGLGANSSSCLFLQKAFFQDYPVGFVSRTRSIYLSASIFRKTSANPNFPKSV